MPPEPVPADPGWDEDLTWLDLDPERDTWLDRAREHDDLPEPEEYEDYAPLTGEELAEIREAAVDELLAVEAATTGRRGPGQPGSARTFPGQSCSPAADRGDQPGYDRLGAESGWEPSLGGGVDASADHRGPLAAGTAPQRGGTGARGAAGRRPACPAGLRRRAARGGACL